MANGGVSLAHGGAGGVVARSTVAERRKHVANAARLGQARDMRTGRTGALVVIAVVALVAATAAQPSTPAAATVLGNVQRFYANANHLTAAFRQVVTNATFNTRTTSTGNLWVAKPALFRWDYQEKIGDAVRLSKTFVFDGTTLWFLDHKNKQLFQNRASGVLPVAVSFLTGGNLATQFNVAFDTSGKYGGTGAVVLELTPKQPSAQYKALFFVVEAPDSHVKESIVIDSSGDTNEFDFYNPDFTSTVKPSWFRVNPASVPTYQVVVVGSAGSGSMSKP